MFVRILVGFEFGWPMGLGISKSHWWGAVACTLIFAKRFVLGFEGGADIFLPRHQSLGVVNHHRAKLAVILVLTCLVVAWPFAL
jgi:hypothetical protein